MQQYEEDNKTDINKESKITWKYPERTGSDGIGSKKRSHKTQSSSWGKLTAMYGVICAYCLEEPAQTVDHVIPWSYSYDNDIKNLRPCCLWCNIHASDKMFNSFEDKSRWLRSNRKYGRSALMRTICTTCLLPYQRPMMTTSMFECSDCAPEYGRKSNQRKEWENFKHIMKDAGIKLPIHDTARLLSRDGMNIKAVRLNIGELYMVELVGADTSVLFDISIIE